MHNSSAKGTISKQPLGKLPLSGRHLILAAVALWMLGCTAPDARADQAATLRDAWDVTVGAGVRYGPKYESGRNYRFEPLPYLDASWYDANGRERTFVSTEDGLGLNVISTDHWKSGPLLTWRPGRRQTDSGDLNGLGDADSSFQVGGYVEYDPSECCDLFAKVRRDVGGSDHGLFVDLGGEINAPIAPAHWFGGLKITTTWANSPGLQPLFGITPEQSTATGLAPFSPSGGFKDVELQPSVTYQFDSHWATQAFVSYERLLDSVTDSPLVKSRGSADQFSTGVLLLYHF